MNFCSKQLTTYYPVFIHVFKDNSILLVGLDCVKATQKLFPEFISGWLCIGIYAVLIFSFWLP